MIIPAENRKRQSFLDIKREFDGKVICMAEIVGANVRPDSAVVVAYGSDLVEVMHEGESIPGVNCDNSFCLSLEDFGVTGFIHMEVLNDEA